MTIQGGVAPSTLKSRHCGLTTVPENRAKKGKTIKVPVFVVKAMTPKPIAPPLVMLNGTLGARAVGFMRPFLDRPVADMYGHSDVPPIDYLRRDRDVVFINQRGAPDSVPVLACREFDALTKSVAGTDHKIHEITSDKRLAADAACHARLSADGIDLASYNIREMADDVHDTMFALGYTSYAIYGVSFGTMLAQQVAKRFPNEVKALILDGPFALDGTLLADRTGPGGAAEKAIRALLDGCAATSSCNTRHPKLRENLRRVITELNAKPAPTSILRPDDPTTLFDIAARAESERPAPPEWSWKLTGDAAVTGMVANMTPIALTLYPSLIDDLASTSSANAQQRRGQVHMIAREIRHTLVPAKDTAWGVNLSVACSTWGAIDPAMLKETTDPVLEPFTVLGREAIAECAKWPVPKLHDTWKDVDAPLVSTTLPTLLLNATFDGYAPAETATKIASKLKPSFVHTWHDRGHALGDISCTSTVVSRFLADPSKNPNAACIENHRIDW